ncbi:hypothetical protein [Mobilicoccus pelagius]|uniref:DUF2339 domain-containing protein n=1 Tax=Mobilicoccus pelagius NBRC 104925 TaxID=1089455 RepID=H5URG8_9MICO|nr:hypothetical protein [Mobilicoccus pelagius]GAB48326.1 hypothetical protein MOPEL_071_00420 [Mobilicoccus pelagius NBRC 104925]
MPPPTTSPHATDPLGVLVTEVCALRRQFEAVSVALGVPPVTCDPATDSEVPDGHRPAAAPAGDAARRVSSLIAGAASTDPSTPAAPPAEPWVPPTAAVSPRTADRTTDEPADTAGTESSDVWRRTAPAKRSTPARPAVMPRPRLRSASASASASAHTRPTETPARPVGGGASVFTPARLLAAGGAIVTILGVGFLLAVAIAAGLFGPVPRVLSLVALSVVLGAVATKVRSGNPEAGVALASTSAAAGFGVVVAATTLYHWFPPLVGIGAGLAMSVAGAAVAHRWRSELLACLLQIEVFVVLPIVLVPLDAGARVQLLLFSTLAYAPVIRLVHEHRWLRLFRVAAAILLVVALVALLTLPAVADVGIGWAGLASSWMVVLLVVAHAAHVDEPVVTSAGLVASVLAAATLHDRVDQAGPGWGDAPLTVALALVLGVAAWRYGGRVRGVLTIGAAVHLLLGTGFLDTSPGTVTALVALEALLLLAAARRGRSPHLVVTSVVFTALSLIGSATLVRPVSVVWAAFEAGSGTATGVALGVLLGATAVLHLRSRRILPLPGVNESTRCAVAALLGLYGGSIALVSLGTLPGATSTGVMFANVGVTVLWVVGALAMILTPRVGLTRVGYAVLALAVGKLFLADLHAVSGVLRAVLFVFTGLALIAASSGMRRTTSTDPGRSGGSPVEATETPGTVGEGPPAQDVAAAPGGAAGQGEFPGGEAGAPQRGADD